MILNDVLNLMDHMFIVENLYPKWKWPQWYLILVDTEETKEEKSKVGTHNIWNIVTLNINKSEPYNDALVYQ